MKISKRGQVTIPKHLRDRFGMTQDVEVEITPTDNGLLIRKRAAEVHPVDRVAGILDGAESDIDEYVKEIRGSHRAVVVLSAEEYDRLCRAESAVSPNFVEHLLAIPKGGPDDPFECLPLEPAT